VSSLPLSITKVEGISYPMKGYREILAIHMGLKFEKGGDTEAKALICSQYGVRCPWPSGDTVLGVDSDVVEYDVLSSV
jgi:hypothetical protein